jgi:hypothetical protein
VSAVVEVLLNQIWSSKVLVLERQDKYSYVLALASPDQVRGGREGGREGERERERAREREGGRD